MCLDPCLYRDASSSLTLEPDLPGGPIGRHPGLAGPLVGPVLQPDHGLARLQSVLVEVPLVLIRDFDAQCGSLPGLFLGL